MKISIVCVGKIKEKYWRDAVAEYEKRLSRYAKVEILEAADEKTPDGAGEALEAQIKRREGERMERLLKEDAYVIALTIDGKMYDSVGFAERIEKIGLSGKGQIVFLIGGSLGMDEELLKHADERVSFGRMTYPHQMMRVILLEQIYRAYRILKGEPYHK
ncbi:MAG: 23S rRNA (pseudouridine(1915)-N(3))-methyltransferase RlmH [Lachnospiraceae bacterium]|nr:23S rRNA (pseudouridine(1915)-N(3))-methyltransferase RlmH [Lachnospiraceae bacterium]